MNKKVISCATSIGALLLASQGWSQQLVTQEMIRMAPPPDMGAAMPGFKVMGIGGIEGKTVSGAPYSAEEMTQTTQTLADGNRIVNTSKSKVYRDQQGRSRVEHTMGNIGGLTAAEPQTVIMIDDPVANVHYTLHPDTHSAEKVETNNSLPGTKEGPMLAKHEAEMGHMKMSLDVADGATVASGVGYKTVIASSASSTSNTSRAEEDLGTQNMEGLQVQGKRTTTTIPAGAMGNERPIQIVDERWYSPELQMNIMTKHSDPRMGDTVFTVTNLSRANPDPSLFQMPADYQLTNTQKMFYRFTKAPNQ